MSSVSGTNTPISVEDAQKTTSTTKTTDASKLDSSSFLTLLMAQLSHQDPMNPMDDSQIMTQMVQMNSVQEMENMNTSLKELQYSSQLLSSAAFIGRTVAYQVDEDTVSSGTVTCVTVDEGTVNVTIDDVNVPLSDIIGIK